MPNHGNVTIMPSNVPQTRGAGYISGLTVGAIPWGGFRALRMTATLIASTEKLNIPRTNIPDGDKIISILMLSATPSSSRFHILRSGLSGSFFCMTSFGLNASLYNASLITTNPNIWRFDSKDFAISAGTADVIVIIEV